MPSTNHNDCNVCDYRPDIDMHERMAGVEAALKTQGETLVEVRDILTQFLRVQIRIDVLERFKTDTEREITFARDWMDTHDKEQVKRAIETATRIRIQKWVVGGLVALIPFHDHLWAALKSFGRWIGGH